MSESIKIKAVQPIIRITHDLKVNPSKAWDIFKKPDRIDWVPGVESCHFDGEIRSLNLPGVGDIKERIIYINDEQRTIEYSCIESPGRLESHRAQIKIFPKSSEDECILSWTVSVLPKELEPFVKQSMHRLCREKFSLDYDNKTTG